VDLLQAVEAHPDVGKADVAEDLCKLFCDESPVRGDDHAKPPADGILRQFRQVLPHEGLAARKQENGRSESDEVVDEPFAFLRRKLIAVEDVLRTGIAVDALEVAAARDVPDDDGPFVF
jgi:hypothetical protein